MRVGIRSLLKSLQSTLLLYVETVWLSMHSVEVVEMLYNSQNFVRKSTRLILILEKIAICKNNCSIYECDGNIDFICSDFLQMSGKIKADAIFLSPPWGGVQYKDSKYYCIKEMMTPNIFQIIKTCFTIANKIIFYFPRTTLLSEFFEIIDETVGEASDGFICADIHILYSANKVKAVMLIYDKNNLCLSLKDVRKYLKNNYHFNDELQMIQMLNIAGVVGIKKFLKCEVAYRRNLCCNGKSRMFFLCRYFRENILTSEESYRCKQLEKKAKEKN